MSFLRGIKTYRKWWKTWGSLPVISWVRAAAHYRAGNYAAAIPLYCKGLDSKPRHPARVCARLDLAYCYFKVGKLSEAESELRTAVSQGPDSREAHFRLAQFQVWIGKPLEAAWTIHRALRSISLDPEIASTFVLAVLDGEGPAFLLKDASDALKKVSEGANLDERLQRKVDIAKARLMLHRGEHQQGRSELARLASNAHTSLEAVIGFSEILIEEGKIGYARQQLRRGLMAAPNHPRILSLLAESYLQEGPFFNPDYAIQLAATACQQTGWESPRELHILAVSYYLLGDKMAALLMASKAKDAGARLMGNYSKFKSLKKLIDSLSTGTLA